MGTSTYEETDSVTFSNLLWGVSASANSSIVYLAYNDYEGYITSIDRTNFSLGYTDIPVSVGFRYFVNPIFSKDVKLYGTSNDSTRKIVFIYSIADQNVPSQITNSIGESLYGITEIGGLSMVVVITKNYMIGYDEILTEKFIENVS